MKVFVYGTLLSGFGNHIRFLEDREGAKLLGEGRTKPEFTMYNVGAFPGVMLEGDTSILGEIYEVSEEVATNLDYLEGVNFTNPEKGLYRRETITLQSGEEVLIYIFNNNYGRNMEVVESGDWRHFQETRKTLRKYG